MLLVFSAYGTGARAGRSLGMIDALISVVIYLIIAGLLWWAVTTIIAVLPIPEPIRTVVRVVLIVILCLIVIYALLPLIPHGGHLYLR